MKKSFVLGFLAGVAITAAGFGAYNYMSTVTPADITEISITDTGAYFQLDNGEGYYWEGKTVYPKEETLNLADDADFATACDLMGQIVDWETHGEELAVMTADGYEMYAYKSAEIYD